MKIIFDIGCHKGQNFDYFFEKSDVVVGFEANTKLFENLKEKYSNYIENKKLFLENVALVEEKKEEYIDFYISKNKDVLSTLYPKRNSEYIKQSGKCEKISSLIRKYLELFKTNNIEYIKIDVEGSDKYILKDLLKSKIYPKNLSIECHDSEILEIILSSPYKSFKFIEGVDVSKFKNINIIDKYSNLKKISFEIHSSGPYGKDIPGDYYEKNSILPYFFNNGLGWKDIHCSIEEEKYLPQIKYQPRVINHGFRYYLMKLIASFFIILKTRIQNLLKK